MQVGRPKGGGGGHIPHNNALTCPALCALIMTPHTDASTGQKLSFSSRFHQAFEASFNRLLLRYKSGVKWFFRRKWLIGSRCCGIHRPACRTDEVH